MCPKCIDHTLVQAEEGDKDQGCQKEVWKILHREWGINPNGDDQGRETNEQEGDCEKCQRRGDLEVEHMPSMLDDLERLVLFPRPKLCFDWQVCSGQIGGRDSTGASQPHFNYKDWQSACLSLRLKQEQNGSENQ